MQSASVITFENLINCEALCGVKKKKKCCKKYKKKGKSQCKKCPKL